METFKKNNEAFAENAKAIETLFINTNTAILEIYKKQLDLITNMNYNFLKSTLWNGKIWDTKNGIPNLFLSNEMTKWFLNPFGNFNGNSFQNPFLATIDKTMKQVIEINQNLLSAFTGSANGKLGNWISLSEKYKDSVMEQLDIALKFRDAMLHPYTKQVESSLSNTIKTTEEILKLYNLSMKENQKLWNDILRNYQVPHNGEESKTKEHQEHENKKHIKVPVHEAMRHHS